MHHLTAMASAEFKKYKDQHKIECYYYKTAAGILKILAIEGAVYHAEFCDEIVDETLIVAQIPHKWILVGTEFQIKVWKRLLEIPEGKTTNYQTIAHAVGHPTSWRAVANAIKCNKIAFFVPCHRVIKKSGDLCGYNGGIARKRRLLAAENVL